MADVRWEGGAAAVAQVNTFAFGGTWETDDLVRVIVGNKQKDFTGGSATTATVVTTVADAIAALDADAFPELISDESGVTASDATTTLTLTANEPGVPFTISLTPLEANGGGADAQTIEGAGTVTTGTAATANSGPNVWGTAANWSGGAVPADTDSVYIDGGATDSILWDLDKSDIEPTFMGIALAYTGEIGLPKMNDLGTAYPEYRSDYLTIGPATLHVGYGPGQGSGRIKINHGTDQGAVIVDGTGSPAEPDLEAFLWKGTNAANTMTVRGNSSVGVAVFGSETATLATLTVDDSARVRCGAGVTLGTIVVRGGELEINSAVGTSLTVYAGTVTINGTGAVAQLTILGGRVIYNTSGTLGGATLVQGDGVLDFSGDPRTKTVTNPIDVYRADAVNDPDKVVSSLVLDFNGAAPFAGLGTNIRLTRAAVA
jgi:hypothetical protein